MPERGERRASNHNDLRGGLQDAMVIDIPLRCLCTEPNDAHMARQDISDGVRRPTTPKADVRTTDARPTLHYRLVRSLQLSVVTSYADHHAHHRTRRSARPLLVLGGIRVYRRSFDGGRVRITTLYNLDHGRRSIRLYDSSTLIIIIKR